MATIPLPLQWSNRMATLFALAVGGLLDETNAYRGLGQGVPSMRAETLPWVCGLAFLRSWHQMFLVLLPL